MKLSTIFSAVLVALNPVGAAIADAAIGGNGSSQFTFTFPIFPGLPAGIPAGSGPTAQCTIDKAGFNETTIASIANASGQVPTAAEMAAIRGQVQAYIHSMDNACNRNCCLGICALIFWIPIVGLACGTSLSSCLFFPNHCNPPAEHQDHYTSM